MRIETERLVLRNWAPADRKPFRRLTNTEAVMRWLGGVRSRREIEAVMDRLMRSQVERGFTFWAVERKDPAEFLGFCGIRLAEGENEILAGVHEIGWRFREDVWGRGYAREAATAALDHAFGVLKAPRVVALTVIGNSASWGLMERLGMKRRKDLDYRDPRWGALNPVIVYEMEASGWPN